MSQRGDLQGTSTERVKPSQLRLSLPAAHSPEGLPVICGFSALESKGILPEQGEKILAVKCLERGPRMGKLNKENMPLASPLSTLAEITPHIPRARNFPKALHVHDLICPLGDSCGAVERTPGPNPTPSLTDLRSPLTVSSLGEGRERSFLTGFL